MGKAFYRPIGRRCSEGTEAKELEGKEKSKVAESELLETGAEEVTLEEEIWQVLKRMKDKKAAGIDPHGSMVIRRDSDKEGLYRIIEASVEFRKLPRGVENRSYCADF